MGNMEYYQSGRRDGLQMALKIAQEEGIEGIEREINFRGKTGINTVMAKKEVEKACQDIKAITCDTILCLSVAVLRDEFGFGEKRLTRFIRRFNLKADAMTEDMATWQDYIDVIREETGIELSIRGMEDKRCCRKN